MRPPRLLLVVFCLIFLPILLTFFSAFTSSPRVSTPSSLAGRASGLHALFSFNIPSSLFPPSAIISLTDDNSTFFLARPAAFGPLLPDKGLSGQLWIGSGFGERTAAGAEGELGCSDIPGWGEGDSPKPGTGADSTPGKSGSTPGNEPTVSRGHRHANPQPDADLQHDPRTKSTPLTNDGTDDHLHHPLPESEVPDAGNTEKHGEHYPNRQAAHADIQSLQESAEIDGKVVLLSRGGCGFLEKVKWVQRRGGIALIVGDDTRGGSLVTMYARGDTSNVTIPALFTSHTTAHLLSSLVPPQGEESGADDGFGPHTKISGHGNTATATTSIVPSSTSSHKAVTHESAVPAKPKAGLVHSLLSFFGLGNHGGSAWYPPEDSRRPPSSGNIDWILLDRWDDQEPSQDDVERKSSRTKTDGAAEDLKKSGAQSTSTDGDGFVIGVQDWRDPDLVVPKGSALPSPTSTTEADGSKVQTSVKGSQPTPATLKGGSITPGSGEYRTVEKSSVTKESKTEDSGRKSPPEDVRKESSSQRNGWFARHFLWATDDEPDSHPSPRVLGQTAEDQKLHEAISKSRQGVNAAEHDGLWVTLTPTSMSTSPFFDTLLVLVVSPLLTLTVVYVLLLLRSRIRRRRWRAPKSLVDRLPVRTYHTITTSSSGSSSPRSVSPGPVSPTSPLLGAKSRSGRARLEPRPQQKSHTTDVASASKVSSPKKEKSGSTLWRRKYTGRQVECVVCLEEYVDGQSRVMSLPCGHEFHAECITPWLTTRRRTCPICKGDVVRSMSQNKAVETHESGEPLIEDEYRHDSDSHSSSSAPVPIAGVSEDETSDLERHAGSETGLVEGQASSAPPSWRNFAALSYSALSGDTIWHQAQTEGNR
ncbi:PA and RING finger domain protein [Aspergillus ibericus CBS 121593]|uniref:RING-type E3 ubiquitin transferase n=1 Tax=Aspergillus ibericus CBS 121593 TaxID=1448316 RepID=A0A395GYP7_9EURO|nr:PA and RING finger domain protein [Aspergillus ibericus CBS 121593]RAL00707.1 PA and RING finger domain protein [Aspergillus ibericus CBS 121593]